MIQNMPIDYSKVMLSLNTIRKNSSKLENIDIVFDSIANYINRVIDYLDDNNKRTKVLKNYFKRIIDSDVSSFDEALQRILFYNQLLWQTGHKLMGLGRLDKVLYEYYINDINSTSGSVTQVRECTNLFMRTAKQNDVSIILVGHVNKDGNIAGPKVLEHIVDTVLYFEGEKNLTYRILRAVKNRFGSTNEIGVFEMTNKGLAEIESPSLAMISGRPLNVSGTCVTCLIEGTRPILAEIQGLATSSGFGNPRRMATGFDYGRMAMLIAILEKRAGYFLGNMDCYVNIIGGLRADEPACDLAVALAIVSSLKDAVINSETIVFGEIGLAGEIRTVNNCAQRIRECSRLGFKRCIVPRQNLKNLSKDEFKDIEIIGVRNIREAFEAAVD